MYGSPAPRKPRRRPHCIPILRTKAIDAPSRLKQPQLFSFDLDRPLPPTPTYAEASVDEAPLTIHYSALTIHFSLLPLPLSLSIFRSRQTARDALCQTTALLVFPFLPSGRAPRPDEGGRPGLYTHLP